MLIAVVAPVTADNQLNATKSLDRLPEETPLFVAKRIHQGMDDRIFPLGWSASGKFAWLCQLSSEGMGDSRWRLSIQDMGTNKVMETQEFDMVDGASIGIKQLWDKHGKAIVVLLKKHQVKRVTYAEPFLLRQTLVQQTLMLRH
jgi:hypothetical protein